MLTFGSVCSGIEAASVAWEPLGMRPLWFAEIEPFPCAVLAHHWPHVPNLGDMTKIAARILAGEIAAPDVLIGGTPCQSFSVAGLGNSLEDPRGQLALAFCQLANAIDDIRRRRGAPECIVLWENVPGVLSTKDNAFGCILAGLAGEIVPLVAPGGSWENAGAVFGPTRTVAWRELDAQYFKLAQRRRRIFAVASARKGFDPCAVLFESQGVRRDSPPSRDAGEDVTGTLTRSAGERGAEDPERGQLVCASVARTLTGGSRERGGRSDDDREIIGVFGGNNTGGAIDVAPALNAKGGSGRMDFESEALCVTGEITHALKAEGADASEDGTGRGTPIVRVQRMPHVADGPGELVERWKERPDLFHPLPFDTTQITSKANRSSPKAGDPCHPLAKGAHPPAIAIQAGALRENPNSGPDGIGVQSDLAYTLEARAEVQAVSVALRGREGGATAELGDDLAHTLRSSQGGGDKPHVLTVHGTQDPCVSVNQAHTLGRNNGGKNALLEGSAQVRRLTPTECERLQGFPDGHTFIPTWDGWRWMGTDETPESCRAEGLEVRQTKGGKWRVKDADGPRYKSLGNSMATKVINWLGRRILFVINQTGVAP